jgi:hypothetical protein
MNGVSITQKQTVKGPNGETIEQSMEITGLTPEEALILLDKPFTDGEIGADGEAHTMRKSGYTYPPGSKYGGVTSVDDAVEIAEGTALGDDIDIRNLGDVRDEIATLLSDANFKFERKDGKLAVEITVAGRTLTFDDEDFAKLSDTLGAATALEEEALGPEGAEEVLPTTLTAVGRVRGVSVGGIATSGNDPATVNKNNDANIQSFNTGLFVFDGLDVMAQVDFGLFAGVIVTT